MSWLRKQHWSSLLWVAGAAVFVALMYWLPGHMVERAFESAEAPTPESGDGNKPTKSPGQVDDELIAHIQAGRYETAYALMTSGYQATVPLRDFEHAVSRNVYLKGSKGIGCGNITNYHGGVHVRRDCIMRSEAGNVFTELYYALEDGEWRMTGIMIGGTSALPGFALLPPPPAEASRQ
ncbi:hypothetical protein ACFL6C_09055 [Myxococcota bacterium]